jgi:hypothetical protein
MRFYLLFFLLLLNLYCFSQDESYFFRRASIAYIKNVDSVCYYLKVGHKKHPNSVRIVALAKKAGCVLNQTEVSKDSDGDGVPDSQDNCKYQKGLPTNNGCPENTAPPIDKDSDGDGVPDNEDNCPTQRGTKSNNGCPQSTPQEKDTDGDGVPDSRDKCKTVKGNQSNNGCPEPPPVEKDSDGDGVPDSRDNCKNQRGTKSNNGCPEDPPAGPKYVDVNLKRGNGNSITWSKELTENAVEIRITFKEEGNGKIWVNSANVTGQNSYVYSPRDARAGDVPTTVTLTVKLKKGFQIQGGTVLRSQFFDCSGGE